MIFPILGEPSASVEPREGSLDDPTFWNDDEALGAIRTLDDFHLEMGMRFCQGSGKLRPLITVIGEEFLQKRVRTEQTRHDENAAVAILNIGRMNDGVEQEA